MAAAAALLPRTTHVDDDHRWVAQALMLGYSMLVLEVFALMILFKF